MNIKKKKTKKKHENYPFFIKIWSSVKKILQISQ